MNRNPNRWAGPRKGKRKVWHGFSRTPEYIVWSAMKDRCYNKNCAKYPRYGGRGIRVCKRWQTFDNFLKDMGPKPSKDHQLDRFPNNDGDYKPSNCRWATKLQNLRNRSNSKSLTLNGVTKPDIEWAKELGLTLTFIFMRRLKGWTDDQILTIPKYGKLNSQKQTTND